MARDGEDGCIAGTATLNECTAIYADGAFAEIVEFYVLPEFRARGVGAALIGACKDFALHRAWSLLEVGAPHLPDWQRTVDFYQDNGFTIIGPRLEFVIKPTLEEKPPPIS